MIYKLLTQEIDITSTANNIGGNQIVRVVNISNSNTVLLQQYANGLTYASASVRGNSEIVIIKSPTDLLLGASQRATAVAYKN